MLVELGGGDIWNRYIYLELMRFMIGAAAGPKHACTVEATYFKVRTSIHNLASCNLIFEAIATSDFMRTVYL